MAIFLPKAAALQAKGITPRVGIYFRMQMVGVEAPVRLWGGVGDCDPGINGLDAEGGVYSGLGELGDIPTFNALLNGKAQRININLSGVDQTVFRLADEEADLVPDAFTTMGLGSFDEHWQVADPVDWMWFGFADVLTLQRQRNGDTVTRNIQLSVGSMFAGRSRGHHSYYTSTDQKSRSPDDLFCDSVSLYSAGTIKKFPDL